MSFNLIKYMGPFVDKKEVFDRVSSLELTIKDRENTISQRNREIVNRDDVIERLLSDIDELYDKGRFLSSISDIAAQPKNIIVEKRRIEPQIFGYSIEVRLPEVNYHKDSLHMANINRDVIGQVSRQLSEKILGHIINQLLKEQK